MQTKTVCVVICITTTLFRSAGWSTEIPPSPDRSKTINLQQNEVSGLDKMKQIRLKAKKGLTHTELVRRIGEPDYCIGEYLECRYASNENCNTSGVKGAHSLVIWFKDNRVTSSDILCVAE